MKCQRTTMCKTSEVPAYEGHNPLWGCSHGRYKFLLHLFFLLHFILWIWAMCKKLVGICVQMHLDFYCQNVPPHTLLCRRLWARLSRHSWPPDCPIMENIGWMFVRYWLLNISIGLKNKLPVLKKGSASNFIQKSLARTSHPFWHNRLKSKKVTLSHIHESALFQENFEYSLGSGLQPHALCSWEKRNETNRSIKNVLRKWTRFLKAFIWAINCKYRCCALGDMAQFWMSY